MRWLLLTALLLPAVAAAQPPQQPALWLPLPPADTGKPLVFEAPARRTEPSPPPADCAALLNCRARLLGSSGRGGAVELKVTPFSW